MFDLEKSRLEIDERNRIREEARLPPLSVAGPTPIWWTVDVLGSGYSI
jgi:hypothetical protein